MRKNKSLIRGQLRYLDGYNDTAHFSVKECKRCDYFSKVKKVWTAMRKRSKIGVKNQVISSPPARGGVSGDNFS